MKIKSIFQEEFKFLISKYNFYIQSEYQDKNNYEIIYINSTTGVHILYEYKESYIFITLYRLEKGILIKNPLNIKKNSILFGYGLDDIIYLLNPDAIIKPSYKYDESSVFFNQKIGFRLYLHCFADNLNKYANNILLGDFSIFKELDQIVKNRLQ